MGVVIAAHRKGGASPRRPSSRPAGARREPQASAGLSGEAPAPRSRRRKPATASAGFPDRVLSGLPVSLPRLQLRLPCLKCRELLPEVGDFPVDPAQFRLGLAIHQVLSTKLLRNVRFELASQHAEEGLPQITPSRYSSLPLRIPCTMKSEVTPYSL